jgi:hypothetical protein
MSEQYQYEMQTNLINLLPVTLLTAESKIESWQEIFTQAVTDGIIKIDTDGNKKMTLNGRCEELVTTYENFAKGCTDSSASNYVWTAMVDDGSCNYEEENENAGPSDGTEEETDCNCDTCSTGCTCSNTCGGCNAMMGDYDAWKASNCGCTDSDASNHDPNATQDDGSCNYA